MFTRDGVTLRPLEPEDGDIMYVWHQDYELDIYAGWGSRRSRALFQQRLEKKIMEPDDEFVTLGIVAGGSLVGRISLQMIDRDNRIASVGILIGERHLWGRGIGKAAVRMLADYAFTVENLDKVTAEVYGFNERSQRLFESVGFRKEGVLRQHELHNGVRQDMHVYGLLREEFYATTPSMFRIPGEER